MRSSSRPWHTTTEAFPAGGVALDGASRLAWVQGDYEGSIRFTEESLILYDRLGDGPGAIRAHIGLGLAVQALGDLEAATSHHEQSLALARRLGRRREEGLSLGNLGDVAVMVDDYVEARRLYESSLAICREVGDAESTATALMCLGLVEPRVPGIPRREGRALARASPSSSNSASPSVSAPAWPGSRLSPAPTATRPAPPGGSAPRTPCSTTSARSPTFPGSGRSSPTQGPRPP